jgi:hypothetical protein
MYLKVIHDTFGFPVYANVTCRMKLLERRIVRQLLLSRNVAGGVWKGLAM